MTDTQRPDAVVQATAGLVQGPSGWRFERIDERSISVKSPTFTVPFLVSLDSPGSCQRVFYNLAGDVLDREAERPATEDSRCAIDALLAVLATDTAVQIFHRLDEGQGTDTDDGRAWLMARALAGPPRRMLGRGVDMPQFPITQELRS